MRRVSGPMDPIIADVVRDGVRESVHLLDAVVVDADGRVVDAFGESRRVTFFRSSLKPIQTAVCIDEGWRPADDAQIAIASASHNAEPAHLAAVRSILASAGLAEEALRCPPMRPLSPDVAADEPARILGDCSGKHAGFLATCVARDWPLDSYLDPAHPLQERILDRTRSLCDVALTVGVDGCGAPAPAVGLHRIAHAFLKGIASAPGVHRAMRAHPFLVAGTGRVDTAVMAAVTSDLVVKAGAEGLMCFASPAAGVGGAIKSRDGGHRPVAPATIAILEHLGLLPLPAPASLAGFATPPIFGGGEPRGQVQVRPLRA